MKPLFIGAVGVITKDLERGRALYVGSIGLPLKRAKGTNFLHSEKLNGTRYFGVWPLVEAAKACFGSENWPADRPVPQMFIEFELRGPGSVASAARELEKKGYRLLHGPRKDPWGQTVARLQTEDGLVVGISFVPWMHPRAKPKKRRSRKARR